MSELRKYPRTQHIRGSRLQPGDEDLEAVPFSELVGRHLVVEEKLDGSNSAVSFDASGELLLQSRGHYLRGGASERQFALLKTWAVSHQAALRDVLGARYVVYGEWLYAKHTVFYDRLPHYFMEFDVLDREAACFLSTPARRALLDGLPVVPVPVLSAGPLPSLDALTRLIRPALYKSATWLESLRAASVAAGQDPERVLSETDTSQDSEGLYLKWEEGGRVRGRYKFIRTSFFTKVQSQETHWIDRPVVPNGLAEGVDLFAVTP